MLLTVERAVKIGALVVAVVVGAVVLGIVAMVAKGVLGVVAIVVKRARLRLVAVHVLKVDVVKIVMVTVG